MGLYDLDAERNILSSVFIDKNVIIEGNKVNLCADDFFYPQHMVIYKYMKKMFDQSIAIDTVTLRAELEKDDVLDKAGGITYLAGLTTLIATSDNVAFHIKIVKDLSTKRSIKDMLSQTTKDIKKLDNKELIKFSDNLKTTLLDNGNVEDLIIDASTIEFESKNAGAIETGFAAIDSTTGGGLNFGTLTILTGNPGSGKSTFLNQILANAMSLGFNSFLYSGELTYQMSLEWFCKTVANPNHLVSCSNNFGKYVKVCEEGQNQIMNWAKDKLFFYSKEATADEVNLVNAIEFAALRKNVKLFILDNLMTLECSGFDKYEKQIIAVKALKQLSKKYNLVIILVAHSNKSSLQNREPHVFEISGASEIPNLADYVFKATRENSEPETTILILKNRITGIIKRKLKLSFDPDRKRFFTRGQEELKRDFGYSPILKQESFLQD